MVGCWQAGDDGAEDGEEVDAGESDIDDWLVDDDGEGAKPSLSDLRPTSQNCFVCRLKTLARCGHES